MKQMEQAVLEFSVLLVCWPDYGHFAYRTTVCCEDFFLFITQLSGKNYASCLNLRAICARRVNVAKSNQFDKVVH